MDKHKHFLLYNNNTQQQPLFYALYVYALFYIYFLFSEQKTPLLFILQILIQQSDSIHETQSKSSSKK